MDPQVGLEPTTLRLTAGDLKNLAAQMTTLGNATALEVIIYVTLI